MYLKKGLLLGSNDPAFVLTIHRKRCYLYYANRKIKEILKYIKNNMYSHIFQFIPLFPVSVT
jgi:hypothetical protein